MSQSATVIDLSRSSTPAVLEKIDYEALLLAAINRFLAYWEAERVKNPMLPSYTVQSLMADPIIKVLQAWAYERQLDRQRVNDAIKSLLAPLARGSDLDAIVARQNVQRLVLKPATETGAAVMESDASLLHRYLLSFGRAAAGSRDGYLYDAHTAWPDDTVDFKVNGHAVHGRRGDIDLVVSGPKGRDPTTQELAIVRAAVTAPDRQPEAVAVTVMKAVRVEYNVYLKAEVSAGPDVNIVKQEIIGRVRAVGDERTKIDAEIPPGLMVAPAYGPNVIKAIDLAPVVIPADPYRIPVLGTITVLMEVRG